MFGNPGRAPALCPTLSCPRCPRRSPRAGTTPANTATRLVSSTRSRFRWRSLCGGGIPLGPSSASLPAAARPDHADGMSLYAAPLVILYPVFTVWLGIGSESKIAFASIYGFLPTCSRPPPESRHRSANCCLRAQHGGDAEPAAGSRHHPRGYPDRAVGAARRRRTWWIVRRGGVGMLISSAASAI